jgi:hypothetical protein
MQRLIDENVLSLKLVQVLKTEPTFFLATEDRTRARGRTGLLAILDKMKACVDYQHLIVLEISISSSFGGRNDTTRF